MARRRPPFEPGGAGAETGVPANASFAGWAVAAQPERALAMQAGSNAVAAQRSQNQFLNHERYRGSFVPSEAF